MRMISSWLSSVDRGLFYINAVAGCLVLAAMTVIAAAAVVARFILHSALPWAEEVNTYLFVWLTVLGAAAALHLGVHPAVDAFLLRMSEVARARITILSALSVALLGAVLLYFGAELVDLMEGETGSAINISMRYPYSSIPYAGACFIVSAIRMLADPASVARTEADRLH